MQDYSDLILHVKDISDPHNGLLWNSAIQEAYEMQKICFSHGYLFSFTLHVLDKELMTVKLADYGKHRCVLHRRLQ